MLKYHLLKIYLSKYIFKGKTFVLIVLIYDIMQFKTNFDQTAH